LRTVDSVNNSNVFLAQIYCMIEKGLLEKPKSEHTFEVLKRVVEEDMRKNRINKRLGIHQAREITFASCLISFLEMKH